MSQTQPSSMRQVRRQFLKCRDDFGQFAAVYESLSERLLGRLDVLAMKPNRILDLGCRNGYQMAALRERFPDATLIGADPAPGAVVDWPSSWPAWLRRRPKAPPMIACDPHHLPFPDQQFDLVVSNLLLPFCHAPHAVFAEVARVLDTGGAFFFTSVGPDTLLEYREAWADVDAQMHVFGVIDMHDLGDAMLRSGFAAPVLDRDNLTVDYPSIDALQEELISVGASNIADGRRRGLMAPSVRKVLRAKAEQHPRFPVTVELVQGHGWKGELKTQGFENNRNNSSGEYRVSIESLRGTRNR